MSLGDDLRKKISADTRVSATMPRALHEEWIQEIYSRDDLLSPKEIEFIEDLQDQFTEFPMRTLTRPQEEWLERLLEKVRR